MNITSFPAVYLLKIYNVASQLKSAMNLKALNQLFGFDSDHELIFAKLSLKKFLMGESKDDTAVCCHVHRNRKLLHFSTRSPGIPEHQLG